MTCGSRCERTREPAAAFVFSHAGIAADTVDVVDASDIVNAL